MNILEKARLVLEQPICDHCLGRQFGQLLSGYTNAERGRSLRAMVAMSIDKDKLENEDKKIDLSNLSDTKFHHLSAEKPEPKSCSLCHGAFAKLDKMAAKAVDKLKGIEFRTFVLGTRLSADLLDAEEALWERAGIDWAEPLKAELNREVGKRIERLLHEKQLRAEFEPKNPQVVLLADLSKNKVDVTINGLFIYGEYQKLKRGIPQTKWPSGKYKTSVEQIMAKPFMTAAQARAHALHGSGREDIDARCLGWRPFVLELLEPKRRLFDAKTLLKLSKKIGKEVKVRNLRLSNIDEVRTLKAARYDKTYSALVKCAQTMTRNELKRLDVLVGEIRQRTPQRVLHRRADRVRKRYVKMLTAKLVDNHTFRLLVTGEAGLYIKELISGDSGRTQPSVSGVLVKDCVCKELDVTKIHVK